MEMKQSIEVQMEVVANSEASQKTNSAPVSSPVTLDLAKTLTLKNPLTATII